jgi:formylglycine-generating enzyme required for sulfatase activity
MIKEKNMEKVRYLSSITWLLLSMHEMTVATETTKSEVIYGSALDPHPDPNEEDYPNMIYIGAHNGTHRIGFDEPNGVKFIFGTSFDDSHKEIEEKDLLLHSHHKEDMPKTREQIMKERHGQVNPEGPKPFGHVDEHPLDGGVTPPVVAHIDPVFLDETLVTNKEFGKFVRSVYYKTEAEHFGWSFVLSSFLPNADELHKHDKDPDAEHWIAVDGAYWREPEGPGSSYKYREDHPVVHVTHRDAAEYCKWLGKRLPGEREWEAGARAGHYGPTNRTLYAWGEDDSWDLSAKYANLWGAGEFPWENKAEDGWRGTSPVRHFPPNAYGLYDMTGNVWEWMRGGKHKARIVRGGSYVDSLDGSFNHAATLGARSTLHGTTSTGNVGFRCAKAPKRRIEYHYKDHDESTHGQLAVEDEFGKQHMIPQRGWEDQVIFDDDEADEDEFDEAPKMKKKKVIMERTRRSNEL